MVQKNNSPDAGSIGGAGFEIAGCDAGVHNTSAQIGLSAIGRADLAADDVREATARIKKCRARASMDIIQIGRDLLHVKCRIGHGEFLPWLEREFGWSDQTARNFMNVANTFGDSNPKALLDLTGDVLYTLAAPSMPPEVRAEAIALAQTGKKVTTKVVAGLKAKHGHTAASKPAQNKKRTSLSDEPDVIMVECPQCQGSGLDDQLDGIETDNNSFIDTYFAEVAATIETAHSAISADKKRGISKTISAGCLAAMEAVSVCVETLHEAVAKRVRNLELELDEKKNDNRRLVIELKKFMKARS